MAGLGGIGARHTRLRLGRHSCLRRCTNYRFFTRSVRPKLQLIEIRWGAVGDLDDEPTTSCPIVLWIVGVARWDLDDLLDRLGLSRSSSEMAEYHLAYVIFRKHP